MGLKHPRHGLRAPVALALAVLASGAALVTALDWPLQDPKPLSYFGTAASGGFAEGLALDAKAQEVKAVDEGELTFAADVRPGTRNVLPSTIGNWMAVEHPRGMVAVYAGLAEGSVASYLTKVDKGRSLGMTGQSGWSKSEGLELRIFDRSAGRWVNPLLLLPPLADKVPPQIHGAWLAREGRTWPLGETKSLPQGRYDILVDLSDSLGPPPAASAPAPYYVRLVVDGTKVAELTFDVALARDGVLRVSSTAPRSFGECYVSGGRLVLASRLFPRGKSVIQVFVRDYAGNERQAGWSLSLE